MRPLSLLANVLFAASPGLLAQDSWTQDGSFRQPPYAELSVQPNLAGDVVLFAATRGLPRHFDLEAAARQLLHCDWTAGRSGAGYAGGTCRGLLRSDGGNLDEWLQLAPLVLALRNAGAARVELRVTLFFWPGQRLETLGAWKETAATDQSSYQFDSASAGDLPPPLHIKLVNHQPPLRPLVPLLVLMTAPAIIALMLRLRARGNRVPAAAWLSWIQLGAWLWWLAVLPPGRIVALVSALPRLNGYLILAAGALTFFLPPLVAVALARAVLGRGVSNVRTPILPRILLPEAAPMVLCGFVIMGMALSSRDSRAPLNGVAMGFGSCMVVMAVARQTSLRGLTILEAEEFRNRAMEIARKAGIRLNGVLVFRHRGSRHAAAFAHRRSRRILVSDRLLENLTKREVDAVAAHELGHLRDRAMAFPPKLYWTYVPVYFAFWVELGSSRFFPVLEPFIVLPALAAVFVSALLSRSRELTADARSAEINRDPHGMIAALARVVSLQDQAGDWGGIAGLLLSHPSLKQRALALAARFGFPASRALAIAANPDALEDGPPAPAAHYAIAAPSPHGEVEFSQTAKAAHLLRSLWLFPCYLALHLAVLSYAVSVWLHSAGFLVQSGLFVLCLPLVLWSSLYLSSRPPARFLEKMRRRIEPRLPAEAGGDFVGLWPGDTMDRIYGFYSWDLGRVQLTGDRIAFAGERARFSLPRSAVAAIEIVPGPPTWKQQYGILVRWHGGSFIVQPIHGASRRQAEEQQQRWTAWWQAAAGAIPAAEPATEPVLPDLPVLPKPAPSRTQLFLAAVPHVAVVCLAGWAVCLLLPGSSATVVVSTGILLFLVALWPTFIASRARKPTAAPASTPAADRLKDEEAIAVAAGRLAAQAWKSKDPLEAERLYAEAYAKCRALSEMNPRHLLGLRNWGMTLFSHASRKPAAEADRMYAESAGKLSAALAIAPDDAALMGALSHALLRRAELGVSEPANDFLARARELLEKAIRIKPELDYTRILWARVLSEQSKRTPGEATDQAVAEARAHFEAVAAEKGDSPQTLRGLALILFAQAMRAEGEDSTRLLRQAKEKFVASETREPLTGAYRAACVSSRLGEEAECRHWLDESREPGVFVTREEMAAEPHFQNVRDTEWFQRKVAPPS